ncbi:MAG: hypothetical protein HY912_05625 [Desulfomonile tiedjei]|uniref:Uncharacterized protein n=1 Tax=Desulfomonile tiedjei TaxID=2358 RepID=A0A9D6Z599_9BACT|nr:hypothetical protein [Desulfomonile tiedjei]
MAEKQTSRDVSAKAAVAAIRGAMSNIELMERFKISPRGFADLLKQLFENKLISEADMVRRGIRFRVKKAQNDLEPESEPEQQPEPEPEPVIAAAPAPKVMSSPKPTSSSGDEEEFLDTVELTKLFSTFGPPQPSASDHPPKAASTPEEPPEEAKEEEVDKKGKFSITGFFKRGR